MRRLRIGLAQINTTVGDFAGNRARILEAARRASERGADLVAFPELAVTGYPPEDLLLRASFVEEAEAALRTLAREADGLPPLIAGCVEWDGALYNAAAVVHGGAVLGLHRKQRLPNYGVFDERRYFRPGRETPRFAIGGVEVAATVCEDIWYADGPARDAALAGAEVIVNLNASPFHAGKTRERERMLAVRAADNRVAIAYVNQVGGQDELVFDGNSLAIGPRGEMLARGASMREDLVVADIDVDAVRQARLRAMLVMALSNKFGALVLTTGNKSEYACGYATLYGDMAGGFAVIKDVPKTLAYRLARHRNARGEAIPQAVLDKPPSAELRPGQLDTDSLPPYEVLDPIVEAYVEDDAAFGAIVARGYDAETVRRVIGLIDRNEYKRRQSPPGVKITPRAFGRDRRYPLASRYRGG